MSQPSLLPAVTIVGGTPRVSSLHIAEHFGKRHERVLDAIRRIIEELKPDFTEHNFVLSEYTDSTGRKLPCYSLTRDAFVLVVMGFTGKAALAWKVRYIEAFNAMEAALMKKVEQKRKKELSKARQQAICIPSPSYHDRCADITAQMLELQGRCFRVSKEMLQIFRDPFWGKPGAIPEDRKKFASSMNYAIQSFIMAINKDIETAELLFNAYVEGEKILNG